MKRFFSLLAISISLIIPGSFAATAHAAQIPGLFNTGVDGGNALLPDGATDSHYTLISSSDPSYPGPATKVVNSGGYPFPTWIADGPDSKWIAPQADGNISNPTGNYVYRITFNLTGFDPASAVVTGKWTADNSGVDILLNGRSTGFSTPDFGFSQGFFPFTISTGFIQGVNTLDFVVYNGVANGGNPTGLRVELSGTASASLPPPPPTRVGYNPQWLAVTFSVLMIAGGFLLRRRMAKP